MSGLVRWLVNNCDLLLVIVWLMVVSNEFCFFFDKVWDNFRLVCVVGLISMCLVLVLCIGGLSGGCLFNWVFLMYDRILVVVESFVWLKVLNLLRVFMLKYCVNWLVVVELLKKVCGIGDNVLLDCFVICCRLDFCNRLFVRISFFGVIWVRLVVRCW